MFDQKNFKEALLEGIKSLVDANVITGQPIISGSITVIPVFKASIGIISGAAPRETPFGGAAGGVSVSPETFIVIENATVKILSAGDTSMVERLVDAAPGIIDKIAGLLAQTEEGNNEGSGGM
ncbi:MAG: hypothetical protein LBO04_01735 [Spirochaetaceae bacterium]|jgi:uncharacterized spore protein YtfJ|nr:hypothetical protein [Spirochaetaceae bacterium]